MSRRVGLQRAVKAAVFLWGLQSASGALGLGLGEMEMRSFLNEPLEAEVALLDLRGLIADDIRIRLAGNDDFNRLGVDRSYFLTAIRFEVEVDDAGRGVIRLTTEEPVLEPYLDLIIEARWPSGRLLREYTVLVDPPAFRQEVITVSAREEVDKTDAAAAKAASPAPAPAPEPASEPVNLRRSDLAPGEMPERAFSAQTSAEPASGSRYMVKRDETLWQIASAGRPGGVSVQQAMLDIQRLNPEAFIDGNINQIKAGYIIYLPAAGDISSDNLARALDEVREQNQAFEARRSEPGVTAAATLRVSAEPSTPAAGEADGGSDAFDGTSSAGMEGGAGPVDAALGGASVDEVPDGSSDSASAELAAQLNAMAARLDTLEQIVALKDEQIATLEQALREAREATAIAAAAPIAEPEPPVATAQPTVAPPAAAPAPAPQEPAGLMERLSMVPILGGLAAFIALLVFLLLRRRRSAAEGDSPGARDATDDVFAGVRLDRDALDPLDDLDEGVDDAPADEDADVDVDRDGDLDLADDAAEQAPVADSRGYGERKHDDYIDEGASGDALAEADIYIAYGRYLQAIELLNTAIEDEPGNGAYRLKLIELYVDMGEDREAQEQLSRLRAIGDEDAISRAERLVGGAGRTADRAPAVETAQDESLTAGGREEPDDACDETSESPTDFDATESHLELDDGEDADEALDLDETLDLDEGAASDAETVSADDDEPALLPIASAADDQVLDFSDDESLPPLGQSRTAQVGYESDDSLDPLDFESLQIEEDNDGLDDDSDLAMDVQAGDELDLSEALGDAAPEAASAGDGAEDLLIAEDADQMATKLDLARAYLDMGDSDGAKVILEQVIGAGTEEQQQEARELISRI